MIRLVVIPIKGVLLVAAIWWARYSSDAFLFLGRTFPTPPDSKFSWAGFAAEVQAYLLVYGPVLAAIAFCFVNWPKAKKETSLRHR